MTYDLPSPRYILVHSNASTIDMTDLDYRCHAFGPFDTYDDVVAFDRAMPLDTCYRFAVPLIGPKQKDVTTMVAGMRAGARPGSMPLPDRDADNDSVFTKVMAQAVLELFRSSDTPSDSTTE